MVVGNPLPKTAEGCAAAPRQFGRATAKKVANLCSTFHKLYFKILLQTISSKYIKTYVAIKILKKYG